MSISRGAGAAKLHKLIAKLSRPNRTKGSHLNPANKPDIRPVLARLGRPGLNPQDTAYLPLTPEVKSRHSRSKTGLEERGADKRLSHWAETNPPKHVETGKTLPEKRKPERVEEIPSQMPGKRISFTPRKPNAPITEDMIAQSEKQGFHGPGNREGIQEWMYHRENPYGEFPEEKDVRGKEVDTDLSVPEEEQEPAKLKKKYIKEIGTNDPQEQQQVEDFISMHPELMRGAMADLIRAKKYVGGGDVEDAAAEELGEDEEGPELSGHLKFPGLGAQRVGTTEKVGLPIHRRQVLKFQPGQNINPDSDVGFAEAEKPSAPEPVLGERPVPADVALLRSQEKAKPRSMQRVSMATATPELLASRLSSHMKRLEREKATAKRNKPEKNTNIRGGDVSRRTVGSLLGPTMEFLKGRSPPNEKRIPPGVSGRPKKTKKVKKEVEG